MHMRTERTPLTAEELQEMSEHHRIDMADFAHVLQNYAGIDSPAEEFIRDLVHGYAAGFPVTPDSVLEDVKQFRANFENAIETAQALVHKYSAEVLGDNCGSLHDQLDKLKTLGTDEHESVYLMRKARQAIRICPSLLVLPEEELQPWGEWQDLIAKYEAVKVPED
jgi:hypothetical protein